MPATGETGIEGPATGQTECLRAAAGGTYVVYECIYILTNGLPYCPARGGAG